MGKLFTLMTGLLFMLSACALWPTKNPHKNALDMVREIRTATNSNWGFFDGQGGDDYFYPSGRVLLVGGEGSELFVFRSDSGFHIIWDFDIDEDRLQLSVDNIGLTSAYSITDSASNTRLYGAKGLLIEFNADNKVFLVGLSIKDIPHMHLIDETDNCYYSHKLNKFVGC